MIVPMQRVAVLCLASTRRATLDALRGLGVLHLDSGAAEGSASVREADADVRAAEDAIRVVRAAAAASPEGGAGLADLPAAAATVNTVLVLTQELSELAAEGEALTRERQRTAPFGDFDPQLARRLIETGVPVALFHAPAEPPPALASGVLRVLSLSNGTAWCAAIGTTVLPTTAERIELPEARQSELTARLAANAARRTAIQRALAAGHSSLPALTAERDARAETRDLAAAQASLLTQGPVCWLTGFCPDEAVAALRATARAQAWGLRLRAPRDDEAPPTLLRPPAIFRPIVALFDLLGIVPGYREADISVVFYAFFTIFFAMLVGDAGYGLLLLAATRLARRRLPRAPAAPFILLTVFTLATIAWGVMTSTYFGIPTTLLPPLLNHRLSRWLADQSNIMQLCFTLGAVHLSIARAWNAIVLFPSRKFLAQVGWVGVIWTMYCVSCLVVVPGFRFPVFMPYVAATSILMIAGFMLDRSELKTQGVDLAMLPLTIIGSLGDVISYVRLFAVGMAGVKVAENFNTMASGLPLPLLVKIPAMVLILLLGHGLNLAMGGLGILVHAVRLNTLEFSSHKGITWAGFAYQPFRRRRAGSEP